MLYEVITSDEQKDFLPHRGPSVEEVVAGREIRERMAEILDQLQSSLNDKEQMILQSRLLSDEPRITSYNVCYTKLLRGKDWILENESDVVVVADLIYSKVSKRPTRWVVAVPGDSNIEKLEDSYNFV